MTTAIKRCAVYTRKSTDEGLDQQFNSLDAQREAGEAYILSQKANGWVCLTEHYDDGGFSGGNTNRPGLKKMLEDIRNGLIDIVVVYKIDRLSRSIYDFAALSKTFDQYGVAFCSVTQEINTTTSSGRMMLNILVTFAQYEREIIAERIRDKMAASKKKGKWVGGTVPFGYMVEDKLLVEEPKEAEIVRWIFHQYQHLVTAREIAAELNESNRLFRGNKQWNLRHVFRILKNRIYIGEIAYKGENYQGEHKPIIEKKQWDIVQSILSASDPDKRLRTQKQKTTAILKGIARCGHCGGALGPTYANNGFKRYLYYICNQDQRRPRSICPVRRVSAPAIEDIVLEQLRRVLQTKSAQEILIKMGFSRETVNGCAKDFDAIWDELFPRERQRIINLLDGQVVPEVKL